MRQMLDAVPTELLDGIIKPPRPGHTVSSNTRAQPSLNNLKAFVAPSVNPRVISNQMIGYGRQKRSSMRSMNEGGNLVSESMGRDVRNSITHTGNCTSEMKRGSATVSNHNGSCGGGGPSIKIN